VDRVVVRVAQRLAGVAVAGPEAARHDLAGQVDEQLLPGVGADVVRFVRHAGPPRKPAFGDETRPVPPTYDTRAGLRSRSNPERTGSPSAPAAGGKPELRRPARTPPHGAGRRQPAQRSPAGR